MARWVGFALAGYSAIANDSIQTIGTFLASNEDKKWWVLWLFIGGIFLVTVSYSWVVYDGDVSHQRLASKGFSEAPSSFTFLQVAAPIFLLLLTRSAHAGLDHLSSAELLLGQRERHRQRAGEKSLGLPCSLRRRHRGLDGAFEGDPEIRQG
ncbi:MAG: hypothetical protein U5K31_05265 [Balneolaceae bacterium]|nr:hypothetical protein [Balneolaceae bacterium]